MQNDEIVKALVALISRGESPDSLEIGSASKGGGIKVYGSFERLEEFKKKIDNAMEARAYAQSKMPAKE
jgi:benzoyl-CoA reductase/2-hydroxyglutaryl-CoA dehydratase subunit BcrC/BadD/HgdB